MTDSDLQSQNGLVFDIKRYAINDGPGIRIVVFLKGCNLRCQWCHNPESISSSPERMYSSSRCIKCGTCVIACPEQALKLTTEGIVTDTLLCNLSGRCAEVCPTKAIELSGRMIGVPEIMKEIGKERIFFDQSGGGVTFSGGEPMLQPEFLLQLLKACGEQGIHRAVDTAGLVRTEIMLEVARHTDLFLYDLKMMDSEKHREWTGVPNEKILENLAILAGTGAEINIRIPVVGGINDDEDNFNASADFIASLAGAPKEVSLLPYHKIAMTKFGKLGRPGDFQPFNEPSKEALQKARAIFRNYGLKAKIGG